MKQKKSLVIYFSLDGNTRFIAEHVAEEMGADICALRLKKDFSHKGFMKYFWGGKQVAFKEVPELEDLSHDPDEYDLIIIGTPVWNSTMTPPVRSLLSAHSFKEKDLAFFCCLSGKSSKTFTEMEAMTTGARVLGVRSFKDPLKMTEKEVVGQCVVWCDELMLNL